MHGQHACQSLYVGIFSNNISWELSGALFRLRYLRQLKREGILLTPFIKGNCSNTWILQLIVPTSDDTK